MSRMALIAETLDPELLKAMSKLGSYWDKKYPFPTRRGETITWKRPARASASGTFGQTGVTPKVKEPSWFDVLPEVYGE